MQITELKKKSSAEPGFLFAAQRAHFSFHDAQGKQPVFLVTDFNQYESTLDNPLLCRIVCPRHRCVPARSEGPGPRPLPALPGPAQAGPSSGSRRAARPERFAHRREV